MFQIEAYDQFYSNTKLIVCKKSHIEDVFWNKSEN